MADHARRPQHKRQRLKVTKRGVAPEPRPVGKCVTGKLRWQDYPTARYVLGTVNPRAERRREVRVYCCGLCGWGWHLTSRPPGAERGESSETFAVEEGYAGAAPDQAQPEVS